MTPKINFETPYQYEDMLNDMIEQYYDFMFEKDRIEHNGYVRIQRA